MHSFVSEVAKVAGGLGLQLRSAPSPQPQPHANIIRRPQVRRAGVLRKNGSKRIVYSKNSLVKYSRGRGAGAENRYTRGPRGVPEMVFSRWREHHFRLGGCAGRPRVREGGSGGLPELMLGSPKVILELSGGHFGFSEGHF